MNYGDSFRDRLKLDRIGPKVGHELRSVIAPLVAPRTRIRHERFELWGRSYSYVSHPYNLTYRNERAVEIPVAADFVAGQSGRCMEFGHVLSHYGLGGERDVVDKYAREDGVINIDILDYAPPVPLDCIISVSTLEHVGWDERPRETGKAIAALDHLLSLLAPEGRLLLTVSLGHNRDLDEAITSRRWAPERQVSMLRIGDRRRNRWAAAPELEVRPYVGRGERGADALWIAEFVQHP